MEAENDRNLTPVQLAERWMVNKNTIYDMCKKGEIPFIRVRDRIIFRESTIRQWETLQETQNCKYLREKVV